MNWLPKDPRERFLIRKWILVGPVSLIGAFQVYYLVTWQFFKFRSFASATETFLEWLFLLLLLCVPIRIWPILVEFVPWAERSTIGVLVWSFLISCGDIFVFNTLIIFPLNRYFHPPMGPGGLGTGLGIVLGITIELIFLLGVLTIPRALVKDLALGVFVKDGGD